MPLLLWLGWYQRGAALFVIRQKKVLAVRIIAGMAGITSWFVAVSYLPISLATVLGALLTIFITLLAPFFGPAARAVQWTVRKATSGRPAGPETST